MKNTFLATAAVALATLAAPALAWEGKVVQCYDKEWVPPTYKSKDKLHKPAKEVWEHRGDQVVLVRYAPVYIRKNVLVREGMWVKVPAACRN